MKFTQPLVGQNFDVGENIHFVGEAPDGAARITMTADPNVTLEDAILDSQAQPHGTQIFRLTRRFSGTGKRQVTARALDKSGKLLTQATISFSVQTTHIGNYIPPPASLNTLNDVLRHLEEGATKRLNQSFTGAKTMFKLPKGEIYFDSKLDLDTDGSRFSEGTTHASGTSLSQSNGNPIDANAVPYYVLPLGGFFRDLGVRMGDIAAVIFGDKVCFALWADSGPATKIGEGSIALHRALGFERIRPNGTVRDVGIDGDVITILFPGSGSHYMAAGNSRLSLPIATVVEEVNTKGANLFTALGGVLPG